MHTNFSARSARPIWERSLAARLLACLAVAAFAACGPREQTTAKTANSSAAAQIVTVTAADFQFDAPLEVPAGMTKVVMINKGHEAHQVQLLRLTGGKTAADLAAAMKEPGPQPSWAVSAGGPNAAGPGATTDATVMLQPGNYVMLCAIPSPDHLPHMVKGMVRPLTVTETQTAASGTPQADVTLNMTDYAFAASPAPSAGTHTLRVDNQGKQDHEAVLIRLAPGKSLADVAAWVDNQVGPPPGEMLGGLTALAPGSEGFFSVDFTPGHYAFVCFVPDATDGKPHIARGMVKEFTI